MLVDLSGSGFHINFGRSSLADAIATLECKLSPLDMKGKVKYFQELPSVFASM